MVLSETRTNVKPFAYVKSPNFCINFWRPETRINDFTVVYDSPSIGAGPSIALFRKLEDGESSDKILSWSKQVTWQLISKFLYSLSVRVTRRSSNARLVPVETLKLWFRLCVISYRLFALAKTDTENCNTYPRLQTDSGRFAFHFCGLLGRHQESY